MAAMRRFPIALLLLFAACQTNPYTGRSQVMLLSEKEEMQMGLQAYTQISKESQFVTDPPLLGSLQRVGAAISAAANKPEYQWEFRLIKDDKTVNAWCLPGGKIAFYTGIYPILGDENGMAIVMGHEVSHALLRHGGERVSQHVLAELGLAVASAALSDSRYHDATVAALGAGATVGVLLPFSRKHETEADKFGLMLAARAGYDPRAAIRVWENMSKMGGGRPPEWLSTHPDPDRRIENMKAWMPEALAEYEKSKKQPNRPLENVIG